MVLRVQSVPNPAVGKDWKYTIPGQYNMDVVAVSATLSTPPNITTVADSGPNNRPLTLSTPGNTLTWGAAGPYAGGSTDYALKGSQSVSGSPHLDASATALFGTNPQTVEALVNLDTGTDISANSAVYIRQGSHNPDAAFFFNGNSHDPADIQGQLDVTAFTIAAGVLSRGAWHQAAVVCDGVNWMAYVDAVLVGTVAGHQPPAADAPTLQVAAVGHAFRGRIAAVAIYPSALSAAQQAAHVAAMSTHDNYKAAVLADSPAALWMLDDTGSMGSRLANLEVTDGTTTVADYPGGTITGVATSFAWTWASAASGIAQDPNATVNLVPIPDLRLPPGYTIGTKTPDIKTTDQWSNINVWWDDGELGPVGAQGFPVSYLNRMIVPDYGGRR